MRSILITGGAGFVGSSLAVLFKEHFPALRVTALDNLKRRGSELILARLRKHGVEFVHGDVRLREDLLAAPKFDLLIDCAAEPSVLAGTDGPADYVISTNLNGTLNCLEIARRNSAAFVFLSTSRVYPVAAINSLKRLERETRFEFAPQQDCPGASETGIAENFPLDGARSLYGASKLASELFVQEYISSYAMPAVVNRCGVLCGPWQMGKIDQGVVVLWVAKHFFKKSLSYIGYGGSGKQVRDILHVRDLFDLLQLQLNQIERYSGSVFNVGGGNQVSVSLRELTKLSQECTGNTISISSVKEDRPNDLWGYISDTGKINACSNWRPKYSAEKIIEEIAAWIKENASSLEPILS